MTEGVSLSALPVLQRSDAHRLPEDAAEVGRRGETGLLGHAADAQLGRFQKLLETTELSIGSVAEQTGFASAAHFRRVFRETMGVGPLQYRKSRK